MSKPELVEPFTARQARALTNAYVPGTHAGAVYRAEHWPAAQAKARERVEQYFVQHVQRSLFLAAQGERGCTVIKVEASANDLYSEALARELTVFLRGRGFIAAYGPHETHYADELEDDEFFPVFVNW